MSDYVYIRSEPGLWTVGFYRPDSKWEPESDHGSQDEAAARVRWLNGGRDDTADTYTDVIDSACHGCLCCGDDCPDQHCPADSIGDAACPCVAG